MVETEALTAVLFLLVLGVVTPGPNNITCIVHSSIHGPRSNIKLIAGMATGFLVVHIVAGLLVSSIEKDSMTQQVLEVLGLLRVLDLDLAPSHLDQVNGRVRGL